jgi:bifunctional DNase/RNase
MAYKYKRKLDWKLSSAYSSGRRMVKLAAFAIVFIAAGVGLHMLIEAYMSSSSSDFIYFLTLPELLTTDYTQVSVTPDIVENEGVITLTAGCTQIVAYTEVWQAQSIARGLAGYVDVRPDVYDVMRDAFQNFGIKVNMLKITEIRNNTFRGKLIIQKDKSIASLDVKPSDGTALAVRVGAPIYINNNLLDEYGEKIC